MDSEKDNITENNIEEDNFDNGYIDDHYKLTLDELIIWATDNLNDSDVKTKLIELKNNLLSGEQINEFIGNFNKYVYDYNLLNLINSELCSILLRLKYLLIEFYNYEEDFYQN